MQTITSVEVLDIRFPTSRESHGSDAMHPDPDYSAAYVTLHTDAPDGLQGYGLTFTVGRGNELCVAAVESLAPLVVGRSVEELRSDMAGFWRRLTSDSQLRWVGPEKGVIHLATAATPTPPVRRSRNPARPSLPTTAVPAATLDRGGRHLVRALAGKALFRHEISARPSSLPRNRAVRQGRSCDTGGHGRTRGTEVLKGRSERGGIRQGVCHKLTAVISTT